MSDDPLAAVTPPTVLVHLLDAVAGRPVQSWRFESKSSLTIGRGTDRDVVLSDPYVSRNHAEFQFRDGRWILLAQGRNGVYVSNEGVQEHPVTDEVRFRLGPNGPMLLFHGAEKAGDAQATLSFDSEGIFVFRLDDVRIGREVEEIVEGDYFKSLRRKAAELRQQR